MRFDVTDHVESFSVIGVANLLPKGAQTCQCPLWRSREPNMRIVVLLILALLAGTAGVALWSRASGPVYACNSGGNC